MKYICVRVEVGPADPDRVSLINSLIERYYWSPIPDVIPHTDPGAIEFCHAFLEADSEDDAYNRGPKLLPPRTPGTVVNDYVIALGERD
jgi:hypothetical protein